MSEKITDYIEVSVLPTDTLFDVSIDITTTPKTRSISKANLASALGLFYSSDGTITDSLRTVDVDTNTLKFVKGRYGFNGEPTALSESVLIKPIAVGEPVLRVQGGATLTDEYFLIDDGGFVGIGATSMLNNEKLRVGGNAHINGVLSIGGAPLNGGQLNLPSGFVLNFNNESSITDDSSNGYISLRCRDDKRVSKASDNTTVFEQAYLDSGDAKHDLISSDATVGAQSRETVQSLVSKYWDGASSDISAFITTVTPTALTGATKVTKSINSNECYEIDENVTASETRFLIYDIDNATLARVSLGVSDSGGAGYKLLRIPN